MWYDCGTTDLGRSDLIETQDQLVNFLNKIKENYELAENVAPALERKVGELLKALTKPVFKMENFGIVFHTVQVAYVGEDGFRGVRVDITVATYGQQCVGLLGADFYCHTGFGPERLYDRTWR